MREKSLKSEISNLKEIIYTEDYIIINVTERYRYNPIPVKIRLNNDKINKNTKSNVPENVLYYKIQDYIDQYIFKPTKELSEIYDTDISNELYPLITKLKDKSKEHILKNLITVFMLIKRL